MRDNRQVMFEGRKGLREIRSRAHSPGKESPGESRARGLSGLGHRSRRCGAALLHLQTVVLH